MQRASVNVCVCVCTSTADQQEPCERDRGTTCPDSDDSAPPPPRYVPVHNKNDNNTPSVLVSSKALRESERICFDGGELGEGMEGEVAWRPEEAGTDIDSEEVEERKGGGDGSGRREVIRKQQQIGPFGWRKEGEGNTDGE
jgi:hypothetical protein